MMGKRVSVTLGTEHFTEANETVRDALLRADTVVVREAFAQRYLGCAMPTGKTLEIHGVPGNDLACYLDGGRIEVFGNAQDQVWATPWTAAASWCMGAAATRRATVCAAGRSSCATVAAGAWASI